MNVMTCKNTFSRWMKKVTTLAFLSSLSLSVATPIAVALEPPQTVYAATNYNAAISKAKQYLDDATKKAHDSGEFEGSNIFDDVKKTINKMDGVENKDKQANEIASLVDTFNSNVNVVKGLIKDLESNKNPKDAFTKLFGNGVTPDNVQEGNIGGELQNLSKSADAIQSKMTSLKKDASAKDDEDDSDKKDTEDAKKEEETNEKSSSTKQTNGVISWQTILGNITIGKEMVSPGSSYYGNTYEKKTDLMGWAKAFASSSNNQHISYDGLGNEARALSTGSNESLAQSQGKILGAYLRSMNKFGYADNKGDGINVSRWLGSKMILMANDLSDAIQTIFDGVSELLMNLNPLRWIGLTDYSGSKPTKLENSDGKEWVDKKFQKSIDSSQKSFNKSIGAFFDSIGLNKEFGKTIFTIFIFITITGMAFAVINAAARHSDRPSVILKTAQKWLVRLCVIPVLLLSASAVGALTHGIGSTLKPVAGDTSGISTTLMNMEGWAVAENFSPNRTLNSASDAEKALKPGSKDNEDFLYQANVRGYLALHKSASDANKAAWDKGKLSGNAQHDMESQLLNDWGDADNFNATDYVSGINVADTNGWGGYLNSSKINTSLSGKSITSRQYADGATQYGILTNSAQENKDKTYVNMNALNRYVWGVQPYLIGDGADNNKRVGPQSTIETRILKTASQSKSSKGSVTYRMVPDLPGTGGNGLSNQSMVALLSSSLSKTDLDTYFNDVPRGVKDGEGQIGMSAKPNAWRSVTLPATNGFEAMISVLNMTVRCLSKALILVASLVTVLMSGLIEMVIQLFKRLGATIVYGRWETAVALIVYNVCLCVMIGFATLVPSILMQVITAIGSFALGAFGSAVWLGKIVQAVIIAALTYFVIAPTKSK